MRSSVLLVWLFFSATVFAQSITLKDLRSTYAGRPYEPYYSDDNPYSKDKILLGKMLFFDPRLSGTNSMSCASCHNPSLSWSDGLARGSGFKGKTLARKTPAIFDLAWAYALMWDGRVSGLENQALLPISNPDEMHMDLAKLPAKIQAITGYRPYFEKAFPGQEINNDTIAKAIATFERSVVSGKAPFDEWVDGNDKAISEEAKKGAILFHRKANCVACHTGWRFTDGSFHDIGVKGDGKPIKRDPKVEGMNPFAFKTMGLRNLVRRAPYMHDGSEKTLLDVIEFYDRGGDVKRKVDKDIYPLKLSAEEKQQLVEFLKTLQAWEKPVEVPVLPF